MESEIVPAGKIARVDERGIVFARQDLFRLFGKQSAQFQEFYQRHPEYFTYDEGISRQTPLGGLNPNDSPMFQSQFAIMDYLGREEIVSISTADVKTNISEHEASRKIKAMARHYGADLVGLGLLNQNWVYSHVGCSGGDRDGHPPWGTEIHLENHTHAIAMGFRMDLSLLSYAPRFPTLLGTADAYARSALAAVCLAEYIHRMGFEARAHHFSNYQVLAIPVAVDCGLGELSRSGLLLTKQFGLGVRLSIVTTDLPLVPDPLAEIGVQSFCRQCGRCAAKCPSDAIPKGGKAEINGVWKWKIDEKKCYAYWHSNGTDCGVCMAVCPWTKPQTAFHRLCASIASHPGPHQSWMAWADQAVYGRRRSKALPDYLD